MEVILPDSIKAVSAGESHTLALSSKSTHTLNSLPALQSPCLATLQHLTNAAVLYPVQPHAAAPAACATTSFTVVWLPLPAATAAAELIIHICSLYAGSGEVWSAGSNNDGQLGLGPNFSLKNAEFRLVRALKGEDVKHHMKLSTSTQDTSQL